MRLLKSVHEYLDYREFLRDYYDFRKHGDPSFSFRRSSELAGIQSPNYLKLVMDGHRHLTVENIHRFARAMRLPRDDAQYFETLVHLGQVDEPEARGFYESRLAEIRQGRTTRKSYVLSVQPFSRWYYPAVALLAAGGLDAEGIAARLEISPFEASAAVFDLVRFGVLEKSADEGLRLAEDYVYCLGRQASREVRLRFLGEQLERSQQAFEKKLAGAGPDRTALFSRTLCISEGKRREWSLLIQEFLDRLSELSAADGKETVMQLNLQFFPVADL